MKVRGLGVLHIRETDMPGALDLLILHGVERHLWMELKVGAKPLEPSQISFIREHKARGELLLVGRLVPGRFDNEHHRMEVFETLKTGEQGKLLFSMHNFTLVDWKNSVDRWLIDHYKF